MLVTYEGTVFQLNVSVTMNIISLIPLVYEEQMSPIKTQYKFLCRSIIIRFFIELKQDSEL